jgi:hypothetical protein
MHVIRTLGVTGFATLASGSEYVLPRQQSVSVSGGVVTVNTNQIVPDATSYAGFGAVVVLDESGKVLTLVDCVK